MARRTDIYQDGRMGELQAHELKLCDLCGCLNLLQNEECFVCGWRGHFETDEAKVEDSMSLATRRLGRLELHHVTDMTHYTPPPPPNLHFRLWLFWRRVTRKARELRNAFLP